jgi:hypothetical protein
MLAIFRRQRNHPVPLMHGERQFICEDEVYSKQLIHFSRKCGLVLDEERGASKDAIHFILSQGPPRHLVARLHPACMKHEYWRLQQRSLSLAGYHRAMQMDLQVSKSSHALMVTKHVSSRFHRDK